MTVLHKAPLSLRAFLAGSLALLINFAFTHAASARDDMAWQFNSFGGGNAPETAFLTFGVPETDDTLLYAECGGRSGGNAIRLTIGGNVGGMRNNGRILVNFYNNRFSRSYDGRVTGLGNSEERISGAKVEIEYSDRIWEELAGGHYMNVAMNNFNTPLHLRGSARAVLPFIETCRNLGRFGGGGVNNPGNPRPITDPRRESCKIHRNARSLVSDTPVTVTFRNRSGEYRSVMWIDFTGQPKEYSNLNPGEDFTINTFLTHPWMFTDGPGNCIEMFMPQVGVPVFEISAPSPGFGPE